MEFIAAPVVFVADLAAAHALATIYGAVVAVTIAGVVTSIRYGRRSDD